MMFNLRHLGRYKNESSFLYFNYFCQKNMTLICVVRFLNIYIFKIEICIQNRQKWLFEDTKIIKNVKNGF